jgi:hypothetical protein
MMQPNKLQKLEFEIVQASDGSSLSIDIGLSSSLARATIGRLGTGRGYCDTEILDTETQKTTHWQHQEFGSSTDLAAALTKFFKKLRDLPTEMDAQTVSFELPLADRNVTLNALLEPLLTVAAGH